jgi:PAS domain-containing protein
MSDTLHGLIKQCPGAIALLQDGVVVDINLPLLELLGFSDRGALIGQRLSAFAPQEDAADLDALLDRAQLLEVDNSIPDSTRLVGTDGSIVEAKLSLYPIDFETANHGLPCSSNRASLDAGPGRTTAAIVWASLSRRQHHRVNRAGARNRRLQYHVPAYHQPDGRQSRALQRPAAIAPRT